VKTLSGIVAFVLLVAGVVAAQDDRDARREALQGEIARMEQELRALGDREGGILDELERLSAELSLGRARLAEISLRRNQTADRVSAHEDTLATLTAAQEQRQHYLAFRLREMYKGGSTQELRRLLGAGDPEGYWEGLQYAGFLSARDAAVLASYRADERRVSEERASLVDERDKLEATRAALSSANRSLERNRRRQRRLLEEIRGDASRRETALAELRSAAADLSRVIEGFTDAASSAGLDMSKFRGLLEWPADGAVRSGFGTVVHPRFKTKVPHPGLDILAESGSPIRSVFEGTVVFSGWMRGYGLTAIVDHGHGAHSVYAHAAVLWVEPGEAIRRGQRLGVVGETGSFSGPSLYFELRLKGQAVDPAGWLRRK
jgi:septal ring factor EnvC (AmiA/AmiB activator)